MQWHMSSWRLGRQHTWESVYFASTVGLNLISRTPRGENQVLASKMAQQVNTPAVLAAWQFLEPM